jgi:general secretion pathway protein F
MNGSSLNTHEFRYRAARRDGSTELGMVAAPNRAAAVSRLAQRGLFPIELAEGSTLVAVRHQLNASEMAIGMRVLATLLGTGLPLARALAAAESLLSKRWQLGLAAVRAEVREGSGLARALGASSLGIPAVVLGIIQSGEAGSGLADSVHRAASLVESRAASIAALRSALAYPMLLAAAGCASLGIIVGLVLPRFANILASLGQTLPASTQAVIYLSAIARRSAVPLIASGILGAIVWRAWVSRGDNRVRWHELLLRVPLFGDYRLASASGRVNESLGALLASGTSLASALTSAAAAGGDGALEERVQRARAAVVQGESLGTAFGDQRAATPTAIRLIRAGEESGALTSMLAHAARLDRDRSELLLRRFVRVLEPSLIIAFGGIVALVATALLQAIYSVRPAT